MREVKAAIPTFCSVRLRKQLLSTATLLCCSLPSALEKKHLFLFLFLFLFLLELY